MSAADSEVTVRWLPGRGACPGGVDLTTIGPLGRVDRAVTLPEALTLGAVIDLLCPTPTRVHDTISRLAADQPARPRWNP